MKYAWIRNIATRSPSLVCATCSSVSASGYYASLIARRARGPSGTSGSKRAVQQVHAESYGIYGSRKIAEAAAKNVTTWSRPAATRWPRRCGNWA